MTNPTPSNPRIQRSALSAMALAASLALAAPLAAQTAGGCPVLPGSLGADFQRPSLVGTWEARITPSDPEIPPFLGFYTFMADGNALFSSAGPPLPALGNPGHGVWRRVTANGFVITLRQNTFTPDLQTDGSLRINANVCLTSASTFVTQDEVNILDPDGNVIVTLGGSARATRMVAEGPSTVPSR